ncbi:oxidoreductase [Thioalkalivibrio denitrificans]|uniref:Oxidoreductase n=1 Tax=Thioalkalivibrio denitrificans TaxID=108003 RepID=A0A1V3NUW6_9GAMM|nr:YhdH/YhfP family quinone oxidoreductase [Thioalkalivibrio denitrificans]OOG28764.1 oxidoreductase [Thioalkalivibrio denitrificans]
MADASFAALMIREEATGPDRVRVVSLGPADLMEGEVEVEVAWSSLNYKDALAVTGGGRILRHSPLVGGIDAAGRVVASASAEFPVGAEVIVTGCGLGEFHHGGFAGRIRVPADWVVPMPEGMDAEQAMLLGTAGFTAAMAVSRFELNRQDPSAGPILVTGASGGVGCLTVNILASRGFEVVALSGKPALSDWLKSLGAAEVLDRAAMPLGKRPLESARWAGAVDLVGGELLSSLVRSIRPWGNVVSIGLAGGADLHTTVMPFILRGVSILGLSSARCPRDWRLALWERLASDLRPPKLSEVHTGTVGLNELMDVSLRMLAGRTHGRILVRPC